jgi:hypothetical protein
MSVKAIMAMGIAAVLLFGWMVYLFASYPVIDYEPDDELGQWRVECGSVAGVGWPTNRENLVDENGSGPIPDSIDGPTPGRLPPDATQNAIHRDCDHRRATRLGFMALLAVPASVLAMVAITGALRRPRIGSAPQSGGG